MKRIFLLTTIILSLCAPIFALHANTKPIIGILCHDNNGQYSISKEYSDAVSMNNGISVIIPTTLDTSLIRSTLQWVDGLIIPSEDNSKLSKCEKKFILTAQNTHTPTLGIALDTQIKELLSSKQRNESPNDDYLIQISNNTWSSTLPTSKDETYHIFNKFISIVQNNPIPNNRNAEKPIIGISCSNNNDCSTLSKSYSDAVIKSGGIAVLIPVSTNSTTLLSTIKCLDGIIMSGGGDIHPSYFNETPVKELGYVDPDRDVYDMALIKMAAQHNVPMLGICRGEQLINVAFGGSLYQDLPSQYKSKPLSQHRNSSHSISVAKNSWIAQMAKREDFTVNTFHHQAVKKIAPGFKATAWSDDGVIEVIENTNGYAIWGVQFHPEKMLCDNNDKIAKNIFEFFIKKASTFCHAKVLHSNLNFISIDTHTDSPLDFKGNYSIGNRGKYQVNLPKMQEGHLDAQYLACWVKQGELTNAGRQKAKDRVDELINRIYSQVELNRDLCGVALNTNDILQLKKEGKKAFLIGIENGYAIGKDLSLINTYFNKGITYITLCHTKNNDICDSSSDKDGAKWNGLSPFGKEVIAEMNRLGILIDLSHASDATFWDVLNLSEVPAFASHSSSRAIFNRDRNLSDEQLKALAETGGVAQACLVDEFLTANPKEATLDHFMNHLVHMIEVAGIDHVGIGSDFDGGAGVKGCNGDNDMIQITTRLIELGFSDEDITKIWGGNFLRILTSAQEYAKENAEQQ